MSQFFFNQRTHSVSDITDGTTIANSWNNLVRLEGNPAIRIVVRCGLNKNNVAVISGGGSGHEPVHVGSIGKGTLTAATCGDVFASPSVDVVLTVIQVVAGEVGRLLIVESYTGDRLSFGLAAKKARRLGYSVEILIISDDISLPDNKYPRGITGTILVYKIVGYFVERDYNLTTILREAQYAINNTFSLDVALSNCHLPQGTDTVPCHHSGHARLGVGTHSEPGISVIDTQNNAQVANLMVDKLLVALPGTGRLAVMVNNLDGVSVAETAIITRELASSPLHPRIDWLIGPASLVTALDMKGFSLVAIVLKESIEKALLTEVETSNWLTSVPPHEISCVSSSQCGARVEFQPPMNVLVAGTVELVTITLSDPKIHLNALGTKVGDGDAGSTFTVGAREIVGLLHRQRLPLDNLAALLALIGERLTVVMGGSNGALMSIFFTTIGQKLGQGTNAAEALNMGLAQTKLYGGTDEGDCTMTDALQPALTSLPTQP